MKAVPVEKLNEVLDTYRDVALIPGKPAEMWLALASLVGGYEDEECPMCGAEFDDAGAYAEHRRWCGIEILEAPEEGGE